jgi:hypothetical protein
MIHIIEQNTIMVAVNNQMRLNKQEISGVNCKGVRNRSLTRNTRTTADGLVEERER